MMNVRITKLSKDFIGRHIEEFIAIASDIPRESWVEDNYLYELPGKWTYSIVATGTEGKVLGFIIASIKNEAIHIHKYAVHADYRSLGLGLKMLEYFERIVKQTGPFKIISLYVDVENGNAIRFYEKKGFEYKHQHETMLFYSKQLKIVVAIHQPNFLPWLGYFNKIATCDKFIILDHVKNKPSDGIYPKRVTIVCNSEPFWLTIPLIQPKDFLFVPLNEMIISTKINFGDKHLKTIEMSYKKLPFFDEGYAHFLNFYNHSSLHITERNIDAINNIIAALNLQTPVYISSSFGLSSSSNQLLIDLIKSVNGDIYLHGSFAVSDKGYQDNELFWQNGIELRAQTFQYPVYHQANNKKEFIPGVSILDAIMNVGSANVVEMITGKANEVDALL